MKYGKIIATVRNMKMLNAALESDIDTVFDMFSDIETLEKNVRLCAESNKKVFLHIDLASGIGKDNAGLRFIKRAGAEGIISTRASIIKSANEIGLMTVQRLFAIDSQSVETAENAVKARPNMVEIMPGIAYRPISEISERLTIPVIAGGLIKTFEEVELAISAGADAISTGEERLWK